MTGGSPLAWSLYPAFGARRVLEHFEALLLMVDPAGQILRVEPRSPKAGPLSLEPGASLLPRILDEPARKRILQALAGGQGVEAAAYLAAGREKIRLEIRVFPAPREAGRRWVLLSPPRKPIHFQLSGLEGLGLLLMHEVNNVLTTLAGFAEFQLSRGDLPGEVQESLREALLLSKRSAEILDFLRTMLREKDLEEEPRPEDPNQPMRDVLAAAGWLLGRKHRLESRFAADPEPVPLRPNLLRMALLNLLLNAGKALGALPGELRLEVREEGGRILYVVADSGPGIQEELEGKIFQAGVTGGSGLGMGLALVREAALLHGGSVEARPLPEGGLEVTLLLPRV